MSNRQRSASRGNRRPNLNHTYNNQGDRPPANFPAHRGGYGNNSNVQRVSQQLNNTVGGYPHQDGNSGQGHFNPNTSYHQPTAPYMVQQQPQQIPYPIPVQGQMMNRPNMGQPAAFYPPMLLAQQQQMAPPMANIQGPPVMVPILYPNAGVNPVLPAQMMHPPPVPMYDNMGRPMNQVMHSAQMQQQGVYPIPQVMDMSMSHPPMHHQMQQPIPMQNERYPRSPSQEMESELQRLNIDEHVSGSQQFSPPQEEESGPEGSQLEELARMTFRKIYQNKLDATPGPLRDFDGIYIMDLFEIFHYSLACAKASHPLLFRADDPSFRLQYVPGADVEICASYKDKVDVILGMIEQLEANRRRLPDTAFSDYDGIDSSKLSEALINAINFIADRPRKMQRCSEGSDSNRSASCSNYSQQKIANDNDSPINPEPMNPPGELSQPIDPLPQSLSTTVQTCTEMDELASKLLWTIDQNKLKTTCGRITDFDGVHTLNLLEALYFSFACVKASHPDWFYNDDQSRSSKFVGDRRIDICREYIDEIDFIFDIIERIEANLERLPDFTVLAFDGVDSCKVSEALKIAINFIAERKSDLEECSDQHHQQQDVTDYGSPTLPQPESSSVALSHQNDQLPQSSSSRKSQESDPSSKSHNESRRDEDKRTKLSEMTSLGLSIYHKIKSNKERPITTKANSAFDDVDSSDVLKLLEFSIPGLNSSNDFGKFLDDWEKELKKEKVSEPNVSNAAPLSASTAEKSTKLQYSTVVRTTNVHSTNNGKGTMIQPAGVHSGQHLTPSAKKAFAPNVAVVTKASPGNKKKQPSTNESHSVRPVAITAKKKQPESKAKPSVTTPSNKNSDTVWQKVSHSKHGPHASSVPAVSNMPSTSHGSSGDGTLKSSKGVVLKGFATPNTEKSSAESSTLPSKTEDQLKDDGSPTEERKETAPPPSNSIGFDASGKEQQESSNVLQDLVTLVKPASDTVDLNSTPGFEGLDETSSSTQEIGTPSTSTPAAIDPDTSKSETPSTSTPSLPSKRKNKKSENKKKKKATVRDDDEDEFGSQKPEPKVDIPKCVNLYIEMAWPIRNGLLAFQKKRNKITGLQGEINEYWRTKSVCMLDAQRIELMKTFSTRYLTYENQGNPELQLVGSLLKELMFYHLSDIITMDLIFLYSKDLKEQFRQNLEVRYLKMVMSVKDWCPESITPVEVGDLPKDHSFTPKQLEYFVSYINRQASKRATRSFPVAGERWPRIENQILFQYASKTDRMLWDHEKTQEFFNSAIAIVPICDYPDSMKHFFIRCFKFLLEVRSSIIDFDAQWAYEEDDLKLSKQFSELSGMWFGKDQ